MVCPSCANVAANAVPQLPAPIIDIFLMETLIPVRSPVSGVGRIDDFRFVIRVSVTISEKINLELSNQHFTTHKSEMANYPIVLVDYVLPTSDFGPRTSDCTLPTSDSGPRTPAFCLPTLFSVPETS